VGLDLVDGAVHTGRHREAAAHVAAMQEAGVAGLSPRLALVTAGAAAMAAGDDEAGALYETALSLPDAGAWPFELARVQLGYGEHLRRVGAASAARRRLVTARDGFTRLGAHPWAARASGRPWAGGTTVRADRVLDAAPPTAQQLEIARMAAAGLTNKQIADRLHLSPRTVGANLYRIFPKLGVTSRSTLGDALAERLAGEGAARRSP
jgi:DNA-binding CsgD family transcriptional regulator